MQVMTILVDGTLFTKSSNFDIPTKMLTVKVSIGDKEAYQYTQIAQTPCFFEKALTAK